MRRAVLGLIMLIALCFAGMAPAGAATKPGSVGLVSYTAASKSSLTISWHKASRATKYQVFVSTSYSGVSKAKAFGTTRSTVFTAKRLKAGTNYYIQVRAMNGSKAGSRSARVGHRTIRTQGTATGPYYKVMTYNVCSRVCTENWEAHNSGYYTFGRWSARLPHVVERITATQPSVLMLQEATCDGPYDLDPPAGYAEITCRSAKKLFYNEARFDLADGEECMDNDDPPPLVTNCTHGSIYLGEHGNGKRYAVWAELVDQSSANAGKHVIFVSVHLVTGTTSQLIAERKAESYTLLAEIKKVNAENYPVVYGGDFNSHKGRATDSVATAFNTRGYHDAFDLAMTLKYQHYNSYNSFSTTPKLGIKWGDHIDHFWVDPTRTRVTAWQNGAKFAGGKYPHPIPSDHNPVVVTIQVN